MFGKGIIEKFTRQLESPGKIQHILPTATEHADEIKVSLLRSRSYYRKMIVDDGQKRYLVYASLYTKYIRKIVSLMTMLSEHKVKVPSMMASHTGLNSLITKKGCYLVLEYVSGKRADDNNHYKTTKFIAENIGRIHAISAIKPGYLLAVHKKRKEITGQHEYAWRNMPKLLEKYPEFTWKLPAKQYNRWFGEKTAIFDQNRPFYLLHGDLNGSNIIIRENGQAVLIDYDGMHYGYPGPELFRCLMANYCRHSLEHRLLFLETYRRYISKENWLLWENNMSAMAGFGILKQISTWLKSSQILQGKGKTEKSRKKLNQSLDYWNWLQDIIATFPDGRGDWPSVMALYTQENTNRAKKYLG
jgi:aminoglycoside phosphotransferase (APT) family kinase protein